MSTNDAVTIIHQLKGASDSDRVAHKPTYKRQDKVIFVYDTKILTGYFLFDAKDPGSRAGNVLNSVFRTIRQL